MGAVTVGITGTGEASTKNVQALLSDFVQSRMDDAVEFVLDLSESEGELPGAVAAAADFALDHGVAVKAVVPQGAAPTSQLSQAILAESGLTVNAANPPAAVVRSSDIVFIAWRDTEDGPDEGCLRALAAAEKRQVRAHDLTDGLVELRFDDGEGIEQTPEPTSDVRPDKTDSASSGHADTVSDDKMASLAAAVASRVVAEITPLIEQVLSQTTPRPRGRPRKNPEE